MEPSQQVRISLKSIVKQINAVCPWNFVLSVDADMSRDFVKAVARMKSPI